MPNGSQRRRCLSILTDFLPNFYFLLLLPFLKRGATHGKLFLASQVTQVIKYQMCQMAMSTSASLVDFKHPDFLSNFLPLFFWKGVRHAENSFSSSLSWSCQSGLVKQSCQNLVFSEIETTISIPVLCYFVCLYLCF